MKVEVNVTEGRGTRRVLDVRVPVEEVEKGYKKALVEIRKEIKIPGFRPGKAPENIIMSRFGDDITQAVMEDMVPKAFGAALKEADIEPVGEPELKDLNLERGKPLEFKATVDVEPEFEPTGYKGLKLKRIDFEVTDEDVEMGIMGLKDRLAVVDEVERPSQKGDIVFVKLTKIRGGDYIGEDEEIGMSDIELDTKRSLPEFVENLTGLSVGEKTEFTVRYPEDYFDEDLANYTIRYRAEIQHIREKKLPETDEEFIKNLNLKDEDGGPLPPEKLDDIVRKDIAERFEMSNRRSMESQAVDSITKANQFDIPISLLERYTDSLVEEQKSKNPKADEEKLREDLRPTAEKFCRWFYIRDAIAAKEGITVDPQEITDYQKRIAKQSGLDEADVFQFYKAGDRLERVKEELLDEKVLDFIIESAEIEDIEEEHEKPKKKKSIIITPEDK
ncbi:MAG: trigger factor [candidate division Zixibacteria bacterium]|nr:trigger factor [candidate division Zixibacteria bacterium]